MAQIRVRVGSEGDQPALAGGGGVGPELGRPRQQAGVTLVMIKSSSSVLAESGIGHGPLLAQEVHPVAGPDVVVALLHAAVMVVVSQGRHEEGQCVSHVVHGVDPVVHFGVIVATHQVVGVEARVVLSLAQRLVD